MVSCAWDYLLCAQHIGFKVKTMTFYDKQWNFKYGIQLARNNFILLVIFHWTARFVLIHDITNSDSCQSITSWRNDIHEKADDEVEIIVLGNRYYKETIVKETEKNLLGTLNTFFWNQHQRYHKYWKCIFIVGQGDTKSGVLYDLDIIDLNENMEKTTCWKLWNITCTSVLYQKY